MYICPPSTTVLRFLHLPDWFKGNRYTFKGSNSFKIVWFPSEKESTLKGTNLLPGESKFFPFKVDPFLEENVFAEKQTGSRKSYLPCKKSA